jgi:allantoinase
MADFDLILRNAQVVTPNGIDLQDVAVHEEKIVGVGTSLHGSAAEEIDATGLTLFPGAVDVHVHFNEPGRADWEGLSTGSAAFAVGGGTTFFDMPLNAHPPTLDRASFELKAGLAAEKSFTDFALWGGLTPSNLGTMTELAECGVIGFKAFLSNSGIEDFQHSDDATLLEGMRIATGLRLPVAIHAENETLTAQLSAKARREGRAGVRDYLASRPAIAEIEAVRRCIFYAQETGCDLHLVHLSTGRSIAEVVEAKARGIRVTSETCPHYLFFTEDDVERIGAAAKCAPPLRGVQDQRELWAALESGQIDVIGSDHSPAPPSMKTDSDFFMVWGGISGAQHLVSSVLGKPSPNGKFLSPLLASLMLATQPARRFHLPDKGAIEVGRDADFSLIEILPAPETIQEEDLLYRHKFSLYTGTPLQVKVRSTWLRGRCLARDGKTVGVPTGKLLKPALNAS